MIIFHPPAAAGEPPLVHELAAVRLELAERQSRMFERAGAARATFIDEWRDGLTFGEVLAEVAPARGGVIVFGSGAVPRLNRGEARRLVEVASSGERRAVTNNRFSSDIVAVGRAAELRELPPLPSDNALPRWLEERAGFVVDELPGKQRLALDLDTPLDVTLAALAPGASRWLVDAARTRGWSVPRLDELRGLATDPYAELLVFGRSGSTTLRWLERNVRCRVRFLAEERGMRASSPLAIGPPQTAASKRPGPRATLGLLLEQRGTTDLEDIVGELADGAIIDSRVLLAHRLGADEASWPSAADRFASDLLRADDVHDEWLCELTRAASHARPPILLGGHSLVGPGVPILLMGAASS